MNTDGRLILTVREGTIIDLPAGDRVWYKDAPLRMQVIRVRDDLIFPHDTEYGLVWVEGFTLADGHLVQRWQELVDIDVLSRVAAKGSGDRPGERRSGPTLDWPMRAGRPLPSNDDTWKDTEMPVSTTDLKGELDNLSLRLVVTRLVYRDVTPYVDDDALVDRVVEDVVRGWQQRDQNASMELGGPDGYWNRYADQVEWASGSGEDIEIYRLEFCPDDSEPFNDHNYYEAVWYAHIAGLPAACGAGEVHDDAGTCGQRMG